MRKLTHNFVAAKFAAEGYQLLSEYKSSEHKLDFICPKGHRHSIVWTSFNRGTRCAHCVGLAAVRHEKVADAFKKEGYQLLSKYKNSKQKLDFICSKGHKHSILWQHFRRGVRCAHCAGNIVTHEQVKAAFEDEGYQLLSEYKHTEHKLDFICSKGHIHSITWNDFRAGCRCAHCAGKIVTHEQVNTAFAKEGYQLLSKYRNNERKMNFICPKGHKHSIAWGSFQQGNRCAYCSGNIVTHEQVNTAFEKEGYQLLSEYKNNSQKLDFICLKGHKHSIAWSNFQQGQRCAHCAKSGYNPGLPGILYYIYFPAAKLYKIGITNRSIKVRYKLDKSQYKIVFSGYYNDGAIPKKLESKILRKYKPYLYKGSSILRSGNSELFTCDVLCLNTAKPLNDLSQCL